MIFKTASFTALPIVSTAISFNGQKRIFCRIRRALILSVIVFFTSSLYFASASESDPLNLASGPDSNIKAASPSEKEMAMLKEFVSALDLLDDLEDLDKSREGMEKLNKVIVEYPEYPDAYFMRSIYIYRVSGGRRNTEVLNDLNNAIRLHVKTTRVRIFENISLMYALRAKIHLKTRHLEQAMQDLETAIDISHREAIIPWKATPAGKNNPTITEKIKLMLELEQSDRSLLTEEELAELATLRANGEIPPLDTDEPVEEQLEWTKSEFDAIIKKYPKDYRGYLFRAVYFYNLIIQKPESYKPAVADLNKAISLNPKCAKAHYLLGEIMAWGPKKSDEEYQKEAILHYTNAIKADPKIKEAYLARAGMYWSSKKYTLAIKDHDKIIELDPDDGSAYHERGFVYNKIGEYWNAIQDFTQALKAKKKVPFVYQTYLNRGKAYDNIGQFNEAISDYTKAIELKIGDVLILMNLTQIRSIYPEYNSLDNKALLTSLHAKYFPNMELDDFSNSLLEEKRKWGDFLASEIFVNRGDTYLRFGRYAKGIDDYRRAEQIWEGYSHERWKYLFDSSKFRVYLDLDTVEKTIKNLYSFWLKYEYTKTKPKEVSYSIQNITIDCLSKKINTLSKVEYDADGNIISNYDVPSGWSTVIPDSLGETIYRGWCNDDSRIED